MSGILKLGGTTLGTENNGTIDLEFHSTSHDFTLKAVDAPIVGANYSTEDNLDSGQLAIYNGATKLWGINESGWVQNPNVPYFFAKVTSNYNPTAGAGHLLNLDNVIFNTGNHYDSSLKKFTAPVAGNYLLGFNVYWNTGANGGYSGAYLIINGSFNVYHFTSPGSDISNIVVLPYYLDAGDYVVWYTYSGNASNVVRNYSYGFGFLIG